MTEGRISTVTESRTQIVSGMVKTAKKSGKTRKSVQVEAARIEEIGGTDTERVEDIPMEMEAGTQEPGGSGLQ